MLTQIPLRDRKGVVAAWAVVDSADAHQAEHRWCRLVRRHTTYAMRFVQVNGKRRTLLLHAEIMGTTGTDMTVDHIDFDGLNNRRANLRVCTRIENNQHRRSLPGSSSRHPRCDLG